MLEKIKDAITLMRGLEGKELFGTMKDVINDAKSDFDKIAEGTNDEDTINNLRGKLGGVVLLSIIVGEKAGCQNSEETDRIFDALPDVMSDLNMI